MDITKPLWKQTKGLTEINVTSYIVVTSALSSLGYAGAGNIHLCTQAHDVVEKKGDSEYPSGDVEYVGIL